MKCRGGRATPPPGISVSVIWPYPAARSAMARSAIFELLPPADEGLERGALVPVLADEEYVLGRKGPDQHRLLIVDQALDDLVLQLLLVLRVGDRVPADLPDRTARRWRAVLSRRGLVESHVVVDVGEPGLVVGVTVELIAPDLDVPNAMAVGAEHAGNERGPIQPEQVRRAAARADWGLPGRVHDRDQRLCARRVDWSRRGNGRRGVRRGMGRDRIR